MTVRVRPFAADRDYPAFSRIHSISEGMRVTPEEARAEDARWDWSYEKVRVVAVDEEDVPLGYGEIYHEPARFEPRRYFVRLAVEPRVRRRGIGAAIWDHLAAEPEHAPVTKPEAPARTPLASGEKKRVPIKKPRIPSWAVIVGLGVIVLGGEILHPNGRK